MLHEELVNLVYIGIGALCVIIGVTLGMLSSSVSDDEKKPIFNIRKKPKAGPTTRKPLKKKDESTRAKV